MKKIMEIHIDQIGYDNEKEESLFTLNMMLQECTPNSCNFNQIEENNIPHSKVIEILKEVVNE